MTEVITFDIEASNLLNEDSIDYCASPWKLKDSFSVHCIVVQEHISGNIIAFYNGETILLDGTVYEGDNHHTEGLEGYTSISYIHRQLEEFPSYIKETAISKIIAHNGINYDLLVCKLLWDMDYEIDEDLWCGKSLFIEDTLVTSKTLNPDRFGGHSLDNLGKLCGTRKVEFRKGIPEKDRFEVFAPDMLYYCIKDVTVNTKVYTSLMKEAGGWDWSEAIRVEKAVAEIVTRQEHRGFKFNSELAERCVPELDALMQNTKDKVEPILPQKTPTKGYQKEVTPPAIQFLKNGQPSSYLSKFVEKHGGSFVNNGEEGLFAQTHTVQLFGKTLQLPLKKEPLIDKVPCSIDDTAEIKEWLVGLGWFPSEWGERDLTMYADKRKGKLSPVKFREAVDRYVEQTLNSSFKRDRCDHLKVTPSNLRKKLISMGEKRGAKVLTNPKFTKGQEKDICPNLLRLSGSFPYAKDIVHYLTYKHRRNSILGGGLDIGDKYEKGFLSYAREDGRIPTPADTCGTSTSRFTHRVVANIPRVTSLYGDNMRALFEVGDDFYQLGYDFDSLEAKIEADGVFNYEGGVKYGESLTAEKPNDCHSVLAKTLSKILNVDFPRGNAKPVKYGCSYNAQPPRIAKTIGCDLKTAEVVFNTFWEQAKPLALLKERMQRYWETKGMGKFLLGLDNRKLPVRSKGNVINTRFQSSGVICAKQAMVLHDRKMRAEGLSVDFFKEDWKNKSFCQQLIAYHDEAQLEVAKDQVKFRTAKTEEEIEEIKRQEELGGKVWSDIGHTDKCYYIGYCRAGELAIEAVKEAGEHYNLNVELTAGYMLGTSWKDCH